MEEMVESLNRCCQRMGELLQPRTYVSPAYSAVNRCAYDGKRLRQWLCRKHKVQSGDSTCASPTERLRKDYGLVRLTRKNNGPSEREGMISSESRMREIRTSGLMSGGLETRPWEPD